MAKRPAAWFRISTITAKSPTNSARCSSSTPSPRSPAFRFNVEKQKIDICFSGSQKALSAPPGMAPITVNSRVEEVIKARKTPVASWYFDFMPIMTMWGSERTYHHTPPISLIFAMREALRLVLEEGLEARWDAPPDKISRPLSPDSKPWASNFSSANPADRLVTVTSVNDSRGSRRP